MSALSVGCPAPSMLPHRHKLTAAMAAVSASSTSLLRLIVHRTRCSASAGIVWVPVPHNRCPRPASRLRCSLSGSGTGDLAVVEQTQGVLGVEKDDSAVGGDVESDGGKGAKVLPQQVRPCELYVCNLPQSYSEPELEEMFRPFGTVQSVEVSRNDKTGISKGCGFVTMSSSAEAKSAISALDGSDLMGREVRVKYSVVMVPDRINSGALNTRSQYSPPTKDVVFESSHKIYIGNLAWSVTADHVRDHFSQFGTVVSARLLHDKKGGQNRVYAFLSFSSADELIKSLSASGNEFRGRPLMVREVV